jgi:hypothetical protein
MDGSFSQASKKYTENVAGFGRPLPTIPAEESRVYKISSQNKEIQMKYAATLALMLNVCLATVYAQQTHLNVKMSFSGNGGSSAIDLKQPNSHNVEENVAGSGTLGPFTFRDVKAAAASPQPSSTCSGVFFPSVAGGGILRFQDGSLLAVNLKAGSDSGDCIDFVHLVAHCTLIFEINGGTGRFQGASGVLTYAETAMPVVFDLSGNFALGTETGAITGTISGVGGKQVREQRQ